MPKETILVVGMGEIGKPLTILLKKTYHVLEKDIGAFTYTKPISVMHVCYPCRDRNFINITKDYILQYKPELTIINSTVIPGTTRAIFKWTKKPLCYSPVRGKHKSMKSDLLKYSKYIAATDSRTLNNAENHFVNAGFKVEKMNPIEALELAKLMETTYFGILIAWAQEIERFCSKLNTDYYSVMRFTKEIDYLPRVIFRPGYIGGHCVIPNIILLKKVFRSDFFEVVLQSNERKAKNLIAQGKSLSKRVKPKII